MRKSRILESFTRLLFTVTSETRLLSFQRTTGEAAKGVFHDAVFVAAVGQNYQSRAVFAKTELNAHAPSVSAQNSSFTASRNAAKVLVAG